MSSAGSKKMGKEKVAAWIEQSKEVDMEGSLVTNSKIFDKRKQITRLQGKLRLGYLLLWNTEMRKVVKTADQKLRVESLASTEKMEFPFKIILPKGKKFKLSAESEEKRLKWIKALENSRESAKRTTEGSKEGEEEPQLNWELISTLATERDTTIPRFATMPVSRRFRYRSNLGKSVLLEEWIAESKLTVLLPQQMLKVFSRETKEFVEDLDELVEGCDQKTEGMELAQSELRSSMVEKQKFYQENVQLLSVLLKSGNFLKSSVRKADDQFAFSPVNLHIQRFSVSDDSSVENWTSRAYLTSGAYSAISKGCEWGSLALQKQLKDLSGEFNIASNQFWNCRSTLAKLEKDMEKSRKKSSEEAECEEECTRTLLTQIRSSFSQLEKFCLDHPSFECLHLEHWQTKLELQDAEWFQVGNVLTEMLEFVKEQRIKHLRQFLQYFGSKKLQLQLFCRQEIVLSQALATVCTGIMTKSWLHDDKKRKIEEIQRPLVFTVLSHLTCARDEKCMTEDSMEAWEMIRSVCRFKLVTLLDNEKGEAIPKVRGSRSELKIEVPVPLKISDAKYFKVYPLLWSIGINSHPLSTLKNLVTVKTPLQERVNLKGVENLGNYLKKFSDRLDEHQRRKAMEKYGKMRRVLGKWEGTNEEKVEFLKLAGEVGRELDGVTLINCKSGKDRTAMAVTLEEGRFLSEQIQMSSSEEAEVISKLRRDGVRKEICVKNIGVPSYAFNTVNMMLLPEPYRPPKNTNGSLPT